MPKGRGKRQRFSLCRQSRHFSCRGCACACHVRLEEPSVDPIQYARQVDRAAWELACYFAPLKHAKSAHAADIAAALERAA